jgi:hypothetical protein
MRVNPQTGQLEDDNGNPLPTGTAVPMNQVAPQGPPPGMAPGALAANARAGQDLSLPVMLDRGGNDAPPMGLPLQTPAAAPSPPVAPQPPPMVRDTGTWSRTHEAPLPAEREAMRQVTLGDKEAERLAGQQGDVDKAKAQQELEAAQAKAAQRQLQTIQVGAAVDQGQAAVAEAKQKYDAESDRLSKMDVKDWWSTRSTGQKIAAAISVAMGALGGALTGKGGTSGVMDILNKSMDDEYRLQRAQIDVQAEGRGREGERRHGPPGARRCNRQPGAEAGRHLERARGRGGGEGGPGRHPGRGGAGAGDQEQRRAEDQRPPGAVAGGPAAEGNHRRHQRDRHRDDERRGHPGAGQADGEGRPGGAAGGRLPQRRGPAAVRGGKGAHPEERPPDACAEGQHLGHLAPGHGPRVHRADQPIRWADGPREGNRQLAAPHGGEGRGPELHGRRGEVPGRHGGGVRSHRPRRQQPAEDREHPQHHERQRGPRRQADGRRPAGHQDRRRWSTAADQGDRG